MKKSTTKKTRAKTNRKAKQGTIKRTRIQNTDKTVPTVIDNDQPEADSKTLTSFESTFDTSFFYTNDKFLDAIDDNQILAFIRKKYPELKPNNTDVILRKYLLKFLDDEKFIEKMLKFYNLTMYDLIKILSKSYGILFKGQFLKKIQNQLKTKSYASKCFK